MAKAPPQEKATRTSNASSNNNAPRTEMQESQRIAANSRVTSGKAREGDKYVSDSPAQQQRVDVTLKARAAAPKPAQRGSMNDYVDMIGDQAFGGGKPAGPARQGGVPNGAAPVPRQRPGKFNESVAGGDDESALDDALSSGMNMDAILGGAAGAAAMYAAQKLFRGQGNAGSNPVDAKGRDVSAAPPKTGDILTRNNLTQGVPSNNSAIDAQFSEIFGLPSPTRYSESGGNEPRLRPGGGVMQEPSESYERPLANNNRVPGPNQNPKQLGDMDAPSYRGNFGYNETAMRAQDIVDKMGMYGDTDPASWIDPSAEPAVYRQVQVLLRNSL